MGNCLDYEHLCRFGKSKLLRFPCRLTMNNMLTKYIHWKVCTLMIFAELCIISWLIKVCSRDHRICFAPLLSRSSVIQSDLITSRWSCSWNNHIGHTVNWSTWEKNRKRFSHERTHFLSSKDRKTDRHTLCVSSFDGLIDSVWDRRSNQTQNGGHHVVNMNNKNKPKSGKIVAKIQSKCYCRVASKS